MKFDKHSRWAATVIAAVAFTSLLSTAARAEDAAGKFVLTHPAHWGAVVLAPGEYTYKLEHQPSELLLIRAANGAPGFIVLCTSVSSTTPGTPDSLKLQKMGEEWFVSSLSLSELQQELHFSPPVTRTEVARNPSANKIAALSHP